MSLVSNLLQSTAAFANPEGGNVVGGSALITSNGDQLNINQYSDKAIIDWRTFNIAEHEHTQFIQNSTSSIALNRVLGNDPSQIMGKLSANGRIIIVNQNGVLFGNKANVNVNSLVATTADITNNDFMAGKLDFNITGNPNAKIENRGIITAGEAGLVGLVAPHVVNSGIINAKLGRVHLASGDSATVDFYGDGLLEVKVSDEVNSQLVKNTGTIQAEGGTIAMTAAAGRAMVNSLIQVDGEVKAPSIGMKNGKIVIGAAGSNTVAGNVTADKGIKSGKSTVLVSAKIDARGKNAGEKGGSVEITGDHIAVTKGAVIDASGSAGGGVIKVGGDYLGGGTTPTAERVIIQEDTSIKANALDQGDGGRITVWSDYRTDFAGTIEAKGGTHGGDGGFVETSGKMFLNASGFVNASAPKGKAGLYLLDPNNVTIQAAGSDTNVSGSPNFTTTGDGAIVTTGSIETILNAGTNVTITAGGTGAQAGDIFVNDTISKTAGGDATLTLSAYRNITVSANITSTSNKLNVSLLSDNMSINSGAINIASTATITTNGGDISMTGGTGFAVGNAVQVIGINISGVLASGGGNISLSGKGRAGTMGNYGVQLNGASANISSTGGAISITGTGGNGSGSTNYGVYINGGNVTNTGSGTITFIGTGGSTGTLAQYGVITTGIVSTVNGALTVTGTAGGTGSTNYGITFGPGGTFRTTGTGNIIVTGTGGGSGTTGTNNYGIFAGVTNAIQTTGSGNITVTGIGGGLSSSGNGNSGIFINVATPFQTNGGSLTVIGTGGGSSGGANYGVFLSGAAATLVGNGGALSITGTGGNSSGDNNYGLFNSGGSFTNTGTGTITLSGTGGGRTTSSNNYGVYNTGTISSVNGNIVVTTATGGNNSGTGSQNTGFYSSSTGTLRTSGSGSISLTAIGGRGNSSLGVLLDGTNNLQASGAGNISVTGTGTGGGTTSDIYGIQINNTNVINAASGTITLVGTGGNGSGGNNYGVAIPMSTSIVGNGGAISITGIGGSGSGNNNFGISNNGGSITNIAAGSITLSGTGGGTGNSENNHGISNGSGTISVVNGNLTIATTKGGGAGSGASNVGLLISGGSLSTSGSGNIIVAATGGNDNGSGNYNYGVSISTANGIRSTGTGTISITGTGGGIAGSSSTDNYGVYTTSSGSITATGAAITINGTGGAGNNYNQYGAFNNGTISTTSAGTITITGTGGAGTGGGNIGFANTGTISTVNGNLTVTGIGKGSGASASNFGFYVSSGTISTSGTGNIIITGTGGNTTGSGIENYGAYLNGTNTIRTTGTGTISVTGTGGGNSGARNYGIYEDRNTAIQSAGGSITLVGTGGGVSGADNYGVFFENLTSAFITNGANISITGTGGNSSGANNHGIYNSSSTISTTGTGTITLAGTAGGNTNNSTNYGIWNAGTISTVNGNLTVTNATGGGAGTSAGNYGLYISSGKLTTSGSGNINVTGTGGNASGSGANNYGVYSAVTNGIQTTGTGNISVTGTGGNASGSGNQNYGVFIDLATPFQTNGGSLSITGTGGGGSSISNYGVQVASTGTVVGNGGAISITGTGGNSSGGSNYGVNNAGTISNTGTGTITIYGTARGTGNNSNNTGVYVSAGNISTVNGTLTITGFGGGGGTGGSNYGFAVNGGSVNTSGSGNIVITATGSASSGNGNYGIALVTVNSIRSNGTGNITLSGTAGSGTAAGVYILAAAKVIAASGSISVTATGGNGTGTSNYGLQNLGEISTSGAGAITISGIGGGTGDSSTAYGVLNSGTISSANGNLTITNATGGGSGTGTDNYGLYISAGIIRTTGAGNINVTATGGNTSGSGSRNYGVYSAISNGIRTTGTGSITITGTGGNTTGTGGSNHGVYTNVATAFQTNGGALSITGTGGNGSASANYGVFLDTNTATIIGNGGALSITGTGGNSSADNNTGIYNNSGSITNTGSGTITLNGTGGGNTNSGTNYGIRDTGTISTVNGNLTITNAQGGGAGTGTYNYGVLAAGTIRTTGSGNINVTATGGNVSGSVGNNYGIYISTSNALQTTGTGSITVVATGGNASGSGTGNIGIAFNGSSSIVSNGGAISITGTGGTSSGNSNHGIAGSGNITNVGSGTITLAGIGGGRGNSASNYGINLSSGTYSTVNGNIVITNATGGGAGNGGNNYGLHITSGTIRTTGAGNITITSNGGNVTGSSSNNYGTYIRVSNAIQTTGTGSISVTATGGNTNGTTGTDNNGIQTDTSLVTPFQTAGGNLTLVGIGGGGSYSNIGIFLASLSTIVGNGGAVSVSGTGGGNAAAVSGNYGLNIAGSITNTGTGTITLSGIGGAGSGGTNIGINVGGIISTVNGNLIITNAKGNGSGTGSNNIGLAIGAGGLRTTGTGNISITALGGNDNGSGTSNHGIQNSIAGGIQTTGTGSITITTTGGNSNGSGTDNYGFYNSTAIASILSNGGAISLTTTGGNSTGNNNHGLFNAGTITNAGTGTITITGTGGGRSSSGSNHGIYNNAGTIGTTGSGNVILIGAAGNNSATNSYGIFSSNGTLGNATMTGALTLRSNSLSVTSTTFDSDGNIILESNGSGNIKIASNLTIAHDRDIIVSNNINSFNTTARNLILSTTGGSIVLNGDLGTTQALSAVSITAQNALTLSSIRGASIFARTTGTTDITIANGSTLVASGTGTAITLASGRNFINLQGSNALQTTDPSARWLVYSVRPADDTIGGLASNFYRYRCTYGGSCPTLGTGNGLLYSDNAVLIATANQINITYGDTVSLTGYAYTLTGYADQNEANSDTITGSLNGSTLYTQGSNVGSYNIDWSSGTLTSSLGYTISYANNATGIVVGARTITLTSGVNANNKVYDGTTAATLALGTVNLSNIYNSDNVTIDLSGATGTFDNANVGTGKNVNIVGLGLTGTKAGNYVLASSSTTAQADITQASLTVTANDKSMTYGDGNNYNGYSITSGSLFGSDTLSGVTLDSNTTLSSSSNWNAGDYTITASNATGSGLSNYSITYASGDLHIGTKALTVGSITASDKVYDATTAATITGHTLSGNISGDNLSVTGLAGLFDNANVGTNKTVTISSATLGGTDSSNYSFTVGSATDTADITQASLTVTANDKSMTYGDGNTYNGYTITSGSLLGSDAISSVTFGSNTTLSGSGNWNAGDYTITASNAVGSGISNYAISYVSGDLHISTKALTVGSITASDKVYDATTAATITAHTLNGNISGDNLSVTGLAGLFDNANVGTNKTVTISSATLGGTDSSNYSFTVGSATDNADITQASLTVTANDKSMTYGDGNTYNGYTITSGSLLGSDALTSVTLGSNTTLSGSNNWNAGDYIITASNASGSGLSNYSITYASGDLHIGTKALTVGSITASDKVYDATTAATVTAHTLSGNISGDNLSVTGLAGLFDNANVGINKTVTISSATLGGTDSNNYSFTVGSATDTADISQASLTVTANDKSMTYGDGNTYNGYTVTSGTLLGTDTLTGVTLGSNTTLSGSNNWNAGDYIITASNAAGSGISNYNVTYVSGDLHIGTKALTVGSITASDKVYDATTTAVITGHTLSGNVSGDNLSVTGLAGLFDNANVGTNKTVTISSATLGGTDSSNYSFTVGSATDTADITQASLTISANDKSMTYGDGNTYNSYTITSGSLLGSDTLSGITLGSNTTLSGSNNWNAGDYIITASNATGSGLSNYNITYDSGDLHIGTKALTVGSVTASDKVYDATTTAAITGHTLNGNISGDNLSVTGLAGLFDNANAGTNKTVTISSATLGGTDSSNYSFTVGSATDTADISQASLTITANDKSMTYGDGNTYNGYTVTSGSLLGSDTLSGVTFGSNATLSGSGNWNAGSHTISASNATGSGIGNYNITYASGNLNISTKAVTINSITASDKVYDATTAATIASYTLNGAISGDTLSATNLAGLFDNANAGNGRTVTISSATLGGTDSGNYNFTLGSSTTTANISKAEVRVKANDLSIAHSSTANYTFLYEENDFKGGQTSATAGINGTVAVSNPANIATLATGFYDIYLDLTGVSSQNYTFVEWTPRGILTVGSPVIIPSNPNPQPQLTSSIQRVVSNPTSAYVTPQSTVPQNYGVIYDSILKKPIMTMDSAVTIHPEIRKEYKIKDIYAPSYDWSALTLSIDGQV